MSTRQVMGDPSSRKKERERQELSGVTAIWLWVSQTASQISVLGDDGRKEEHTVTDECIVFSLQKDLMC